MNKSRRVLVRFFACAAAGVLLSTLASAFAHERDFLIWPDLIINTRFAKRWRTHTLIEPRLANGGKQLYPLVIRNGVGYDVYQGKRSRLTLLAGADWNNYMATGPRREEVRPWQQAILVHRIKKLTVTHRLMMEEQFGSKYNNPTLRGRYRICGKYPLANKWYVKADNEIFLIGNSINKAINGLTEDRVSAVLGYDLTHATSLEAGYMLQAKFPEGEDNNRFNHALAVRMIVRL